MVTAFERFVAKINTRGPVHPKLQTRCWLWTAHLNVNTGYGAFGVGSKSTGDKRIEGAHRIAWALAHGQIPEGLDVLHACDVHECVRPSHLFTGTAKDNAVDMVAKGRQRGTQGLHVNVGSKHGMSKLNEEKVGKIKLLLSSGMTQRKISDLVGVRQATISRIKSGKRWGHVA